MFNDDLDSIFGRPQRNERIGSTRSFISNLARNNSDFREFRRSPFGRASVNTASLLARLSLESRQMGGLAGWFGDDSSTRNSAKNLGRLNSINLEFASVDILGDLIEGLISKALSRRKTTTSVSESDHSVQAQKNWNSSRSEQDALLATRVQRGLGEL